MEYTVTVNITLDAETREEAQDMAAACLSNANEDGTWTIQGVGGARGWVRVEPR